MPLEELMEAIDTSVHRVVRHREALQQSGALTRTSLVEPVLRALGWDTGDPLQVRPDQSVRTESGRELRVDLTLTARGRRTAVCVLPLDHQQHPDGLADLMEFCRVAQMQQAVVTDGNSWKVLEVGKQGGGTITTLCEEPAHRSAMALLALWPQAQPGEEG